MYPNWIIDMFTGNTCPKCRSALTLSDIDAIGIRRPLGFEGHLPELLALVIATCKQCGGCIHFSTRCPKEPLIDAVEELAELIKSTPARKPPLFGPGAASTVQGETSSDGAGGHVGKSTVRPSIRADQKLGPMTEEEVGSFLAWLKRISFKSGSKSLRRLTGSDPRSDS